MKITVLVDNDTLTGRYFKAEPALALFIEADNLRILFDTGYSDITVENSKKMNIDLCDLDYVILSHGHLDHSWGLISLIKLYTETVYEKKSFKKPVLITHPLTLESKTEGEIGSIISKENIEHNFKVKFSPKPLWITKNIVFLGEIAKSNDFEFPENIDNNNKDVVIEDSAIAIKTDQGLVIVTGCSHSGICNIIEYAKKICDEPRVRDVIGGFHLLNTNKDRLKSTVEYFKNQKIKKIHPCHCTDLFAKTELSRSVKVCQVGVGLEIKY